MASGKNRLAVIDGLRLSCALAVVMFHYCFQQGNPNQLQPDTSIFFPGIYLARYGYLGVNIFFMISGFVIAFSASGQRAAVFAWHRWLRIYPTFVFCLAITAAVIAVSGAPRFTVSAREIAIGALIHANAANVAFVDPVYWTISCEVWFYTFVFVGMLIPAVRRRSTWILASWLAIATADQMTTHGGGLPGPMMTSYAGLFCSGIFLYRTLLQKPRWPTVMLLVYSVLFSLWLAVRQAGDRFAVVSATYSAGPIIAILLLGIAMIVLATQMRVADAWRPLLFRAGGITFPLYLLHDRIGAILIDRTVMTVGAVAAVLIAAATSLALSWIVFAYVEPVLKAGCIGTVWRFPDVARFLGVRPPPRHVATPPPRPIASEA